MLKNYLVVALRSLRRERGYAALNLSRWLDSFAYRVGLGPGPFLTAGALLFVLALATVSAQALRAAVADPVRSLRSE